MGHPLGSLLGKHIKLPAEASITTMAFAKMGLAVAFLASCLVLDSLTTGTEQPGSTTDDEETISTATPTSVITIRTITSNPITTTTNTVTYQQELIEGADKSAICGYSAEQEVISGTKRITFDTVHDEINDIGSF